MGFPGSALLGVLPRGPQLATGSVGESTHPYHLRYAVRDLQLLARVAAAAFAAKPFTVEEVSTGKFGAGGGRAQMTDRLTVQPLGLVALAEQRAGACRDSQAPGGAGRQCELGEPSHGGSGQPGLAAADGCLDQLGQREVREGQVVALFAGKLR